METAVNDLPILLGSKPSPFVRKVRVCLAEKNRPYQFEEVNVTSPDSTVYSNNPLGKIPCLMTPALEAYYDSSVIVEYLEAIAPTPALFPADAIARVQVKRIEALADGILDAGILLRWETYQRPAGTQDPAWIARQTKKLDSGLQALGQELGDRQYFIGNTLTYADLCVGVMLGWLTFRFPDHSWPDNYPGLRNLLERLNARESFATTRPS